MVNPKVVLITGCSSGFGLVTAVEMARAGFRVFASMRNLNKRGELERAAQAANAPVEIIELDVTKEESIASAIEHIVKNAGHIDILVNNAGYGYMGFVEELSLKELKEQLDTNFFGCVAVTKAVIPIMRERHSGHIINISSVLGLIGLVCKSPYCASKFAVEGFMESLRYEGLLDGYYVSNIEPGYFKTNVNENYKLAGSTDTPHFLVAQNYINDWNKHINEGADPKKVADLIIRISQEKKPKLRYPVGKEKLFVMLKRFLPERIFEYFLMKKIRQVLFK